MKKAVLISIKPDWCEYIFKHEKTKELRKNKPNIKTPFKCYVYCTKTLNRFNGYLCYDFYYSKIGWISKINAENADLLDRYSLKILNGKIIGEFICNSIDNYTGDSLIVREDRESATYGSCVSKEKLYQYLNYIPGDSVYNKKYEFYGWNISDVILYNEPKDLYEFRGCQNPGYNPPIKRPPQNWCYVEELNPHINS